MAQGISPNNLNKISQVYLSQISEHHKKDADGNTIPHEGEEVEEGAGLYACLLYTSPSPRDRG